MVIFHSYVKLPGSTGKWLAGLPSWSGNAKERGFGSATKLQDFTRFLVHRMENEFGTTQVILDYIIWSLVFLQCAFLYVWPYYVRHYFDTFEGWINLNIKVFLYIRYICMNLKHSTNINQLMWDPPTRLQLGFCCWGDPPKGVEELLAMQTPMTGCHPEAQATAQATDGHCFLI